MDVYPLTRGMGALFDMGSANESPTTQTKPRSPKAAPVGIWASLGSPLKAWRVHVIMVLVAVAVSFMSDVPLVLCTVRLLLKNPVRWYCATGVTLEAGLQTTTLVTEVAVPNTEPVDEKPTPNLRVNAQLLKSEN